ncbi:Uncharacterised protein [Actinomyces bovis]|uniref:SurA N-terminal domain n=1 Tax=Actinomyces bovis TaxID=1658 RepID=A0ABY1VMH8_9ACTO|nr:hypothetical protein [Actinomyces bovis]SPT53139.1 Uncharacterised protein [Actinomyces bovis]VEG52301.1 Uncharacterised protein [Actinomyces israelii]
MISRSAQTSLSRVIRPAGAILTALALLGGCGIHPGVAAVESFTDSSGQPISLAVGEQDISDAVTELSALQMDRNVVLSFLLDRPVLEDVMKSEGVTISEEEATTFTKNLFDSVGQHVPKLSVSAKQVMQQLALADRFKTLEPEQMQRVRAKFQEVRLHSKHEISPRYTERPWIVMTPQGAGQQLPQRGN